MIARVSKRGKVNSFFDIPDRKMVARVSKRGFFDENKVEVPRQMVARVSKKGFFVPDKSMVARVSKKNFFIPDRNMVARVSKKSLPDNILNRLSYSDGNIEDPYGDVENMKNLLDDFYDLENTLLLKHDREGKTISSAIPHFHIVHSNYTKNARYYRLKENL